MNRFEAKAGESSVYDLLGYWTEEQKRYYDPKTVECWEARPISGSGSICKSEHFTYLSDETVVGQETWKSMKDNWIYGLTDRKPVAGTTWERLKTRAMRGDYKSSQEYVSHLQYLNIGLSLARIY